MLSKVQIKTIHALQHKKYRQKSGRFVAEGIKVVEELLQSRDIRVETLYALPSYVEKYDSTTSVQTSIVEVSERELKSISFLTTPQEVLAVCQIPDEESVPDLPGKITLMLEAIRNPGNLGTIIRIADWFGISQIACSPDCVDAYNPKVVQATMGSLSRVKLWYGNLNELLKKYPEIPSYAATLNGNAITEITPFKEGIILIGNESNGLSEPLTAQATKTVTIPRIGKAESLNAAVATGIICGRLLL